MKAAGFLLVLVGILINKWTLEPLAHDGNIEGVIGVLIFFVFQWPAILAGMALILGRRPLWLGNGLNFLLAVTSLLFIVALLESAIRYTPVLKAFIPKPRTYVGEFENRESQNFIADKHTGWRMRPNVQFILSIDGEADTYTSNDQGFRDGESAREIGTPRKVALVGDSFAWGWGVEFEDTFGVRLEDSLGDQVRVYNFGMPGFGLDQIWMSLRHQALPLMPDLIIVAFIDDDLDRTQLAYRRYEGFNKPTFKLENGHLRPQTKQDRPNNIVRFLETYSGLWTMFRRAMRDVGFSYSIGEWWLLNQAILKAINSDAKAAGTPVIFVRLPMKERRTFLSLHRLAQRESSHLIDLGGPETTAFNKIHFSNDMHLNEDGHAFIAGRLAQWIKKNRLLE